MKTKCKKILACLLSVALFGSIAAGCNFGVEKLPEGKDVHLEISPFNGGYSLEWLDAVIKAYEVERPEVYITYSEDIVSRDDQLVEIQSGVSDYDIYMTGMNLHGQLYNGLPVADITDVYEAIGDRINPAVVNWYNHEGKQYALPWSTSVLGILYHKDMFTANNITVPRTSNELIAAADKFNAVRGDGTGPYAFAYCAKDNYWSYLFNPWFAQYEGIKRYEDYWNCIGTNGRQYDRSVVAYEGILRTLEVYETLLKDGNNYNHPSSKDSNFTDMQIHFLDRNTAMMVNGDWVVSETMKSGNYEVEESADVAFMRTPIISSIVETMELWADGDTEYPDLSTAKKDEYDRQLAAIIDAVDRGESELAGVSQNDFKRIQEARSVTATMADGALTMIPTASKNIDEAKEFLKFMYSDKGIAAYNSHIYGTGLPVHYEKGELDEIIGDSALLRSAYDMLDNAYLTFFWGGSDRVFSQNGLTPTWHQSKIYLDCLAASNPSDYRSAKSYYEESCAQIAQSWNSVFLRNV